MTEALSRIPTILVVDDEPLVLKMAERIIRKLGYNVVTAECGQDALTISREHDGAFDLLLTDLMMEEIGGVELADVIRERFPGVKVLFTSGYNPDELPNLKNLEGHFLSKPYTFSALADKIRKALDQ